MLLVAFWCHSHSRTGIDDHEQRMEAGPRSKTEESISQARQSVAQKGYWTSARRKQRPGETDLYPEADSAPSSIFTFLR